MTKVKICGLQEVAHVQAAVEAGVDAIGLVFAPSSRQITFEQAAELVKHIPEHILKVGVFVNPAEAFVKNAANIAHLDYIQYHGQESDEFIKEVGLPAIKALPIKDATSIEKIKQYTHVEYFLFDTPGEQFEGGSGKTFDWTYISGLTKQSFILAGGLTVENVATAIQQTKPFMVDVSSGVETNKRKDVLKIKAFINEVKNGVLK